MLGRRPLCLCEPPRYQVSKRFTFYHYLFVFHTSRCTADRAEPIAFPCHGCNLKNNNVGEKHRKHKCCSWTITGTPWLSSRLLGTWCSNGADSGADLWSSECFVSGWRRDFLLHMDPLRGRDTLQHRIGPCGFHCKPLVGCTVILRLII